MKNRKLWICIAVLLLLSAVPLMALAEGETVIASGTCGENLTWTVYDSGDLHFSGSGPMEDYPSADAAKPWDRYDVTMIYMDEVTHVGDYAFANMDMLSNIAWSVSVTSIGDGAFADCDGLTRVHIISDITQLGEGILQGCDQLQSVTFDYSSTLTHLPDSAFRDCGKLSYLRLPEMLTHIGDHAFDGCTSLQQISLPEHLEHIGSYAFQNCPITSVTIGESVTSIGAYAFAGCSALTDVTLRGQLSAIEDGVFADCKKMGSLILPKSVQTIGAEAFRGCEKLPFADIPSGVTGIGSKAFSGCSGLGMVSFRGNAPEIAPDAFEGVTAPALYPVGDATWTAQARANYGGTLKWLDSDQQAKTVIASGHDLGNVAQWKVTADGTLTITSRSGNFNADNCEDWKVYSDIVTRIVVSDGIYTIGSSAFSNMDYVTEVILPDTIEYIGDNAFAGMDSLLRIEIPDAVTYIRDGAFSGCDSLEEVSFGPDSKLVEFGEEVFENCVSLRGHLFLPETLTRVGWNVFKGCFGFDSLHILTSVDIDIPTSEELRSVVYGGAARQMPRFENKTQLVEVSVGGKVSYVTSFAGCTALSSVTLSDSVRLISDGAFRDCVSLKEITFPAGVVDIGLDAFAGVTATLRYPARYAMWDAVAGQNYGGQLTWEPYGDPAAVELASGKEGKTRWKLNSYGEMTISGTGEVPSAYSSIFKNYGKDISKLTIEEGITGIGFSAMPSLYLEKLQSIVLADSVTSLNGSQFSNFKALETIRLSQKQKTIPNGAFSGCENLKTVELPEGLTTIERYAFRHCSSLTQIKLPDSLTTLGQSAFYECTGLTSIELPAGVKVIGYQLFYGCDALQSVTCKGDLNEIMDQAFWRCGQLKKIVFEGNAPTNIGRQSFYGVTAECYYPVDNATWLPELMKDYGGTITWLPYGESTELIIYEGSCGEGVGWSLSNKGVLRIFGEGAMTDYPEGITPWSDYREQILTVMIDDGVSHVGDYAFYTCAAVTRVSLGNDVVSIGLGAFAYSGIDTVTLPESLVSIGAGAFGYCENLTAIQIPKNVTDFPINAIAGCSNLQSIGVDEGNAVYSGYWGMLYNKDRSLLIRCPEGYVGVPDLYVDCWMIMPEAFANCTKITYVQMLDVWAMGEGAFKGCTALERVALGVKMTTLPADAFASCESLKQIEEWGQVTQIGANAFSDCTGLKELTLPASLKKIGSGAFSGCKNLKKVTFTGQAPAIEEDAFTGVTATVVYPPNKYTWTSSVMKKYGGKLTWKKGSDSGLTQVTSGKCSSTVRWKLYENGRLVISGTGAVPDYTPEDMAPWLPYVEEITEVVIEEGITRLGAWTIRCPYAVLVQLPASLKDIDPEAFMECEDLVGYYVHPNNSAYASENGVLYSKDKTRLISCPQGYSGDLVLAAATKTIDAYALAGCRRVTSVELPAGLTQIGDYAFAGCIGELLFADGYHTGLMYMRFAGDAPAFGESVFLSMIAEITYPGGNRTWTEAVRQDYGGIYIHWRTDSNSLPGDINGDGKVNNKDASRLFQYLSGWDVEVDEARLDINGDGKVNNKDASRLFQYLSGWDVEIH